MARYGKRMVRLGEREACALESLQIALGAPTLDTNQLPIDEWHEVEDAVWSMAQVLQRGDETELDLDIDTDLDWSPHQIIGVGVEE